MSISIYVHVPFCASKCGYCDFYSAPASEELREKYVSALINQICNAENTEESVESVYFGGGTPTVLTEKQLYGILEALDKKYGISAAEKTLEVNPDSVLTAKSDSLLWFDRFSMGVQSFDDGELHLLGRRHTAEDAERAYYFLRSFAKNVNLDLMIGLPFADHKESLKASLRKLISLDPEHASVYILKFEEGTPLYRLRNAAMDGDEVADLYLYVSDLLTYYGYEHYEISNFAKKGFRSVHNCVYWNQGKYLAFGSGAYGFDGKTRFHYKKDFVDYIEKCGNVPKIVDEVLDSDGLFLEKIVIGFRLVEGVGADVYKRILEDPSKKQFCDIIMKYGYARLTESGGFALTPKGWTISNFIIEKLM